MSLEWSFTLSPEITSKMFWGKMKKSTKLYWNNWKSVIWELDNSGVHLKDVVASKNNEPNEEKKIQSFHNLTFWSLYCSILLFCVIFKHDILSMNLCLLHCWVHLPSAFGSLVLHNIITVLFTYELSMICRHCMFVWSHKQHFDVNE